LIDKVLIKRAHDDHVSVQSSRLDSLVFAPVRPA